MKARGSFCSKF